MRGYCPAPGTPDAETRTADIASRAGLSYGGIFVHFQSHDEDGTMKSYDYVQAGMTQFVISTQGLDESVAKDIAGEMMQQLPAWSDLLRNGDTPGG